MASNLPFNYPPPAIPGANTPMYRGRLYTSSPGGAAPNSPTDLIHFQFNPNSIKVAYSGDLNAIPRDPQQTSTSSAGSTAQGLTTCSFQVFFDRTVEVANGSVADGVFQDVHTIEQVYGIFQDQPGPGGQPGAQSGSPAAKLTTFVFSEKVNLQYRGFVTSIGIEYLFFSPQMVPLRCSVDFTMSQVQGQGQANTPGGLPPSSPATAVPMPVR